MGEEQNAFRRDRRGEDNMYVVNELIERARMNRKKYYFAFLNIEKVYDRVNRDKMRALLERIEVSEKVVKIIKSSYE